jgi:hypothetical protein
MFLSDMENVRIKKLKKQAPEEIPLFLKAAGIFETIDGLSITGDRQKLEQIEKILDFRPATRDGRDLRAGIISKAKAKSQEGMFGGGTFLID